MTFNLKTLMAASVSIGGRKPGTGYLVAPNRIATCHHVVDLWTGEEEVKIGSPDPVVRQAHVVQSDEKSDCAILGFEKPVDIDPLPLAADLDVEAYWDGFGFPHSANGVGTRLKGEVLVPKSKDETDRPIIQLYSPQAGSGQGTPLHGFSGSPVLVEGAVCGHMIRHIGDPDDRKRPAFGIIYAAPVIGIKSLLDIEVSEVVIHPPKLAEPTGLFEEVQKSGVQQAQELDVPEDQAVRLANTLVGKNRPDLALDILGDRKFEGVRARQIEALALAKSGKTDEAISVLKSLVDQGNNDQESLGLLAGRYKEKWRDMGDMAALRASYEIYRDGFARTDDPYNGINAAATALYLGERSEAERLAAEVHAGLENQEELGQWDLATLGEAASLQDDFENAKEFYRKAVAADSDLVQNIAAMRRQARLNMTYLGKPQDTLDDTLPVPGVLAFAGHMIDDPGRDPERFPEGKIGAVRMAIREHLEELGMVQGFGTAARGSDIIFLEELVRRKVKPVVVMPFPEEDFRRISVGDKWGRRLDKIRDRMEFLLLKDEAPDEAQLGSAFAESNARIQELAVSYAERLGDPPQLMVVWDSGYSADGPGRTTDVVDLWREEGYEPIIIDINAI